MQTDFKKSTRNSKAHHGHQPNDQANTDSWRYSNPTTTYNVKFDETRLEN